MSTDAKKPGVSPLWRTAMLCVLVGMGVHWWVARSSDIGNQGLIIRGDPVPTDDEYNPRLDQELYSVDFEKVPLPTALLSIAKRVGINLVLTNEILDQSGSAGPQNATLVTAHLKRVKAGDALNSLLRSAGISNDVRTDWSESGGILYSTSQQYHSPRLFTRFYDVKRLLDRHDAFEATHPANSGSPTTQPDGAIFRSGPAAQDYTDGRANWLEQIIDQQTTDFSTLFAGHHGISRSYYPDVLIVTATVEEHRIIAKILRQLDEK